MYVEKFIIKRRCDEPMKRSKEECRLPNGKRWRCTKDCRECICCIYTTDDGREAHVSMMYKNPEEQDE